MAIHITCDQCKSSYNLKDEFAGNLVKCSKCGASIRVAGTPPRVQPLLDIAFDRDKFLLRQKHFAISEKYYVWDEQGQTILFIERPAHLGRNLLAVLAGIVAAIAVAIIFGFLASVTRIEALQILFGIASGLGAISTGLIVGLKLSQKRHVTFYRDDTKQEALLVVRQDKKFQWLKATYTVRDANGELLATLSKNYLYDIFRKQWNCYAPDGTLLCAAKEDSIILALLRRLLGVFFGVLRTNFIIVAEEERVIGEFNRQFTLLDRYVLDMSADAQRSLDRRIAVALGVMLDTGERR